MTSMASSIRLTRVSNGTPTARQNTDLGAGRSLTRGLPDRLRRPQFKMQPQRLIDLSHLDRGDSADPAQQSLGCYRSDLLNLRLCIDGETRRRGQQQNLERIDLGDIARYG